jgi:hypothetical protein
MTTLTIRRLGAEVPADVEQASPARVDRLLRLVADRALGERHAIYGALSGEWYVRRLDLHVDLAVDEPDGTAAARWAALIAGTIRDLVPDGSNVLHFRSRGRLLLDLVVGLATGDLSRAWAWRQAGLLTPDGPDPADRPGAALVAAAAREPRLAVPVLVRAAEQVGVRRLHATLGPAGWVALADLVRPGWLNAVSAAAEARSTRPGGEHWAAAVLASSALARTVRSEGIVPDDVTRSAWAVLVLAETDPVGRAELLAEVIAGLAHPEARTPSPREPEPAAEPVAAKVGPVPVPMRRADDPEPARPHLTRDPSERTAADLDSGRSAGPPDGLPSTGEHPPAGTPPGQPDVPATTAPARPAEPKARPDTSAASVLAASVDDSPAEVGTVPPDAEAEPGAPTNWAGLLFLLNAASAAGLPDVLETDVRLAARPLRWMVHQLALRMVPVRADDPAALALAGLPPAAPVPAGAPSEPAEEAALVQHAAAWAAAVGHVLEQARHPEDDTPIPTLWSLARRPGWIVADPGWLEVQLNLDEVDLLVRRAGLDLDPGWLDWLGTVVVFRYV